MNMPFVNHPKREEMSKDDAEYLIERIESMLGLLRTRVDSETGQMATELNFFLSRLQPVLTGECPVDNEDIEMDFYALLGSQPSLGLLFLTAMESDLAVYYSNRLSVLSDLEKAKDLTVDETNEKRWRQEWLRLFKERKDKSAMLDLDDPGFMDGERQCP